MSIKIGPIYKNFDYCKIISVYNRGGTEFQDMYDHAGRTRATNRGFIKYLLSYEQDQSKKSNPER